MVLFSWSWAWLCRQLWGHNVRRTLVLNRPDWCYAMRFFRHKLMVNNTEKLTFAWFLRPWECRVSSCLLHELWGLLNVIRKWVAITAAYGFMEKCVKGLDSSRLGFAPPTMERYSRALSVLRYPSSSGQTQVWFDHRDAGTRIREKRTKPVTR